MLPNFAASDAPSQTRRLPFAVKFVQEMLDRWR
jgi:hypothetical protein